MPTGEREDKGKIKREFREKLDLKEKEKERLREQLRSTSNEKLDVMLGKRKGAPPKTGTPLHSASPVWSSEVAATAATSFLAPKETPRGVHLTKKESKRFKLVLEQYPSLIDGKCKYLVSPLGLVSALTSFHVLVSVEELQFLWKDWVRRLAHPNHCISREEWKKFLGDSPLTGSPINTNGGNNHTEAPLFADIFRAVDTKKDGVISFQEYVNILAMTTRGSLDEKLQRTLFPPLL